MYKNGLEDQSTGHRLNSINEFVFNFRIISEYRAYYNGIGRRIFEFLFERKVWRNEQHCAIRRSKRACHGREETSGTFASEHVPWTQREFVRASFKLFYRCSGGTSRGSRRTMLCDSLRVVGVESVSDEINEERRKEERRGKKEWTQCCETRV